MGSAEIATDFGAFDLRPFHIAPPRFAHAPSFIRTPCFCR